MKLSVPLLALTLCAAVVAVPFVPPVNATTSAGKEVKNTIKSLNAGQPFPQKPNLQIIPSLLWTRILTAKLAVVGAIEVPTRVQR
jgi:hypothetical protein